MKNRAQGAAALLENFDKAKSALKDSENAAGSAKKENDKYMESIQAHLAQLQNAYNEMWASSINRDTMNFWIDLGKNILNIVHDVGLLQSAVAAGVGIYSAVKTAKGNGMFKVQRDETGLGSMVLNDNNFVGGLLSAKDNLLNKRTIEKHGIKRYVNTEDEYNSYLNDNDLMLIKYHQYHLCEFYFLFLDKLFVYLFELLPLTCLEMDLFL